MTTIKTPKTIKAAKTVTSKKAAAAAPLIVAEKKLSTSVKYHNKNLKISPRKLRSILPAVKKLTPAEAFRSLSLTNTTAARLLAKSIQTAIADAKNNFKLNPDTLRFVSLRVDEGLKIKRMDKSHGSRYARGLRVKRHSRLEIILQGEAA